MTLFEIAYKNLLRRKAKAAFILAGLVVGVATVVGVITYVETTASEITNKLEKYGANILVTPKTDQLTLSYGGLSLGAVSFDMAEIQQSQLVHLDTIKNAQNIAAVGPMVIGAVQVGDKPLLLAGVDFEVAPILKPWWRINGQIPDEKGLVIGSRAAQVLGLQTGDTFVIKEQPLQISGVLKPTGSQDDHLLFSQLTTAQTLLGKPEKLSMVEVAALCEACPIEDMVQQISGALPGARVMAIQQVVKGRMETLSHFKKFSYGISAVVILIGSLVVLVTLMGSVRERTEEIGIFRAVGFRRRHVMRIIFFEAGAVSLVAGVIGYLLGYATVKLGLTLIKGPIAIPFDAPLALMAVGLALTVGLISSAYPAWMASRLDPSRALRTL